MTLIPEFDSSVYEYAATTTNATNKVTATATDPDAEITIMLGDTEIENGESATWEEGKGNRLEITVGDNPQKYTVMVTSYPKQTAGEQVSVDIENADVAIGNPLFNSSGINSAIEAHELPTAALVTSKGTITGSIMPVVSDIADNEYVDAGITLDPDNTIVATHTKNYAISLDWNDSALDIVKEDKIIQVDETHIQLPISAICTFENLTTADGNFTAGWNLIMATLDSSTYEPTAFEFVHADDLNEYIDITNDDDNTFTIEGVGGSDIYNGIIYILP